jgi:hypothetical protein
MILEFLLGCTHYFVPRDVNVPLTPAKQVKLFCGASKVAYCHLRLAERLNRATLYQQRWPLPPLRKLPQFRMSAL